MNPPAATRAISILASVLASLAVVVPPVTYIVFSVRYLQGAAVTEAAFSAEAVTQLVSRNPTMWQFEHVRLVELLSRRPFREAPEARRVVGAAGAVVAAGPGEAPAPAITTAVPIYDAGAEVGRVEISRSLRPTLARAALLALALLPFAALTFVLLRTLPVRAIRRSAAALGRSEARFRALIEKSTDLIMVLDAELRVRFWSPGAADATGWTALEMAGRAVLDVVHEEDHGRVRDVIAGILAHPDRPARAVLSARHRDGGRRTIEAVIRNLLDDPAVAGMVVNARDVTDERRLEQRFQQGQRLESIGRLAGGIAHDFNNLLTVILGCTEALGAAAREGAPARAEDVDDVHRAAERARELTRHLLAFARKQVLAPVALDLNEVLRGSERLLRRVLGEDVELVVSLAPDLWSIRCDPAQIEQVVVNLAANARDAMPRSGTLTLQTTNARLGADEAAGADRPAGEYVRLVVRDTGTGLSAETKAHLFEPFFTTKPTGRGTGLGLATVYGIVNQSGGFLRVDSAVGAGTTFELFFPRTHEVPAPAVAAPPRRSTGGSETILVVEDDAHVQEVTVRALRAAGYRVLAASGGADALGVPDAELCEVQLLVTDVVMPGLDGRELALRLHERRSGLRVLYVSGYTDGAIADRGGLEAGSDFLAKPFTATALLSAVRALLDAPVAGAAPARGAAATAITGVAGP